jgi:hypothetical protein
MRKCINETIQWLIRVQQLYLGLDPVCSHPHNLHKVNHSPTLLRTTP